MNLKKKTTVVHFFLKKDRTVISEHTKYGDNYEKKMFVYLHA